MPDDVPFRGSQTSDPPVPDLPGLDVARLRRWLDDHGLVSTVVFASLVDGGMSNLTYRVDVEDDPVGTGTGTGVGVGQDGPLRHWVLRRPPLGHVLATAHDMVREYTVQRALAGSGVPVPRMVGLCRDEDVLGAPFYLMERVEGRVLRTRADSAGLVAGELEAAAYAAIDVLADLHAVDADAAGLADFGRPDGYLARQVRRWTQQLDRSRSRELVGVDDLARQLAETVPPESDAPHRRGVVHGDYRLDNIVLAPAEPRVAAILDWEMATIGDPLADLGLLATYASGISAGTAAIGASMAPDLGWPPTEALLTRYADRIGLDDADRRAVAWCTALGHFKLAVIVEGIHYRYTRGQTVGPGFENVGAATEPLVAGGLAALDLRV